MYTYMYCRMISILQIVHVDVICLNMYDLHRYVSDPIAFISRVRFPPATSEQKSVPATDGMTRDGDQYGMI